MHMPAGTLRKVSLSGIALLTVVAASACSSSSKKSAGTSSTTTAASQSSGSGSAPSGSPYVIGDIGTYSGPYAASSQGGKDALDAWTKYTNAHGGINGHPIQLIVKDDQASSSLALTEAKELVTQDHVIALVGNLSITEGAWDQYMSTQPVPVIGDDLATNAPGTYHNFFPEGATQQTEYFYGVPKVASTLGYTKFGAIYCAEGAVCAQIADAQKQQSSAAGVKFLFSTAASATAPSYTAQCLSAKSSGATAVALLLAEPVANNVAKACEQQGYHPQWLQGGNGFTQAEASQPAMNGNAGPVPDFPWFASDNPAEQEFQAAMRQYEPQDFKSGTTSAGYSEGAAQGWASAVIFGAAMEQLSSVAHPTGVDVMQALYKLPKNDTFGGLTPPISYTSSGPQPPVTCFFTVQIKNGSYSVLNGGKTTCTS